MGFSDFSKEILLFDFFCVFFLILMSVSSFGDDSSSIDSSDLSDWSLLSDFFGFFCDFFSILMLVFGLVVFFVSVSELFVSIFVDFTLMVDESSSHFFLLN